MIRKKIEDSVEVIRAAFFAERHELSALALQTAGQEKRGEWAFVRWARTKGERDELVKRVRRERAFQATYRRKP